MDIGQDIEAASKIKCGGSEMGDVQVGEQGARLYGPLRTLAFQPQVALTGVSSSEALCCRLCVERSHGDRRPWSPRSSSPRGSRLPAQGPDL